MRCVLAQLVGHLGAKAHSTFLFHVVSSLYAAFSYGQVKRRCRDAMRNYATKRDRNVFQDLVFDIGQDDLGICFFDLFRVKCRVVGRLENLERLFFLIGKKKF